MRGAIDDGTRLRLIPPEPVLLRRGAVVMATLPDDRLVVHRITAVDRQGVTLRGDALLRSDGRIPTSAIVAVVDPTPPRRARSLLHRIHQ